VLAAVTGSAETLEQFARGEVEGSVTVGGLRLRADDRTAVAHGDLHPLADLRQARVALVRELYLDPLRPRGELRDLGQLAFHVGAEAVRDLGVTALDDDLH